MINPKNTPKNITDVTSEPKDGELRRSLLILKSRPQSNLPFEQFLSRRNWDVTAISDLKNLFAMMTEKKPQYVMIPIDHADQKVGLLPRLLVKAFPCIVIPYAEETTSQSVALLNQIDSGICLYPPISGPAFERLTLKLSKAVTQGSVDLQGKFQGSTLGETHIINIKGNLGNVHAAQVEAAKTLIEKIGTDSGPGFTLNYHAQNPQSPLYNSTTKNFTRSTLSNSIIARGTEASLEQSVKTINSTAVEFLGKSKNIASLEIKSTKFSGHLIVAFGRDRVIDQDFLDSIRENLQDFMHNQGEDFYFEHAVQITVNEVYFNDWAMKKADFVRTNVHDGAEVAVGFFPGKIDKLVIEPSIENEFLAISVDKIQTGEKLGFDFYLYLRVNKKYVHYAVKNLTFEQSRKERLLGKGVDKIHFRKEDLHNVEAYHLRNFLNSSISTLNA